MSDPTSPRHSWTWWPATPHPTARDGSCGPVSCVPACSAEGAHGQGRHGTPAQPDPAEPVLTWSAHAAAGDPSAAPPAASPVSARRSLTWRCTTPPWRWACAAEPFLDRRSARRGTSAAAAIATAAYDVLVARVPGQRTFLDPTYPAYLAGIPDGPAKRSGVDLGAASPPGCWPGAPATAWTARCRTSSAARSGRVGADRADAAGRPGADPGAPAGVARDRPVPAGRPAAADQSRRYARDLDEVQRWAGSTAPSARAADRDGPVLVGERRGAMEPGGAPDRRDRRLNLGQAARLLAAVHVSAGDAAIACFDAKYHLPVRGGRCTRSSGPTPTGTRPPWPDPHLAAAAQRQPSRLPVRARMPDRRGHRRARAGTSTATGSVHVDSTVTGTTATLRLVPRRARRGHRGAHLGRPALPVLDARRGAPRPTGRLVGCEPPLSRPDPRADTVRR